MANFNNMLGNFQNLLGNLKKWEMFRNCWEYEK